ncbi:MAG: hypothetical protein WC831_01620 [Parcubacteria group bacterium]|jgi:hypothetical protein
MTKKGNERIEKLIKESGNNFHYQVVNFLREKAWTVLVSPYYNDSLSDKSKEIDIVAEKIINIKDKVFGTTFGQLKIRFFIECKYINNDIAFWFDERDKNKARELVIKSTPLKENNSFTDKHHYLVDQPVAKLFSSNANKEDVIYKALSQSLNSMIYFEGNRIIVGEDFRSENYYTIKYPIILCNGFSKFYKVEGSDYSPIDYNFQLEVNYAYLDKNKNSRNDYHLIDIIDFNKLDNFLIDLENADISAISEVLAWDWKNNN